MMSEYLSKLQAAFKRNADAKVAKGQKAYMKDQFEFYGITAPERKRIQQPFLNKNNLPEKNELERLVKKLWQLPQREYQMFGQELVDKYSRKLAKDDIALLEYMITFKSWWDTVDFIAARIVGNYFKLYPELRKKIVTKWLKSGNIWLQRSALLFQLKYKAELDTALLSHCVQQLLGSKEFFINKAIGWILREYSKTNPEWVWKFVHDHPFHSLSKREALRLMK